MSVFGEIYTTVKKFYTSGGSGGSDKSHHCLYILNKIFYCQNTMTLLLRKPGKVEYLSKIL